MEAQVLEFNREAGGSDIPNDMDLSGDATIQLASVEYVCPFSHGSLELMRDENSHYVLRCKVCEFRLES